MFCVTSVRAASRAFTGVETLLTLVAAVILLVGCLAWFGMIRADWLAGYTLDAAVFAFGAWGWKRALEAERELQQQGATWEAAALALKEELTKRKDRAAFTLIELLTTIVIISILAGLAFGGDVIADGRRQRRQRQRIADAAGNEAAAVQFMPVRVLGGEISSARPRSTETAVESSPIEIMLGGGSLLRVWPGFDRKALLDVLGVLEGRGC